ncbi:hypothetical protein [Cyclobacterium plantarum]|uniref:hypothetical protein n=1 Tax=Cyclobacterium plantarum TaxID=2716263 RepID=UPI003F6ED2AB
MKNTILILILIFTIELKAQDLTISDFNKTEWFADNENRNFYESDTVSLLRILKFNNENDKLNELNIKLQKNNNRDITQLEFKSSGRLNIQDLYVESWIETLINDEWKWKFDSVNQILELYQKGEIHSSFKIDSKQRDNIIWKFEDNSKITESKLDLLVLNLNRLKK